MEVSVEALLRMLQLLIKDGLLEGNSVIGSALLPAWGREALLFVCLARRMSSLPKGIMVTLTFYY